MSATAQRNTDVIWHDAECGAYAEDLPLWEQLAAQAGGPVLDVGCGTGRVTLHLARRDIEVAGLDLDRPLVDELRRRAAAEGLAVDAEVDDVREPVDEPARHALAIASMQLIQLLGGAAARVAALRRIASSLRPGGVVALAIVEGTEGIEGAAGPGVVPDVRDVDGWVYSSLPLEVRARDGRLEVLRLRQTVTPAGDLTEDRHLDRLDIVDAAAIEAEAQAAGLVPAGRRPVAQSEMHVGSTVVLARREG